MEFKELNKNTVKARHFLERFINSKNYTLEDCYNTYSYEKLKAFDYCVVLELRTKAKNKDTTLCDGTIISYNTNSFTYAFSVNNDLYVITRCNNYVIKGVF